jgi:hypothetical protein
LPRPRAPRRHSPPTGSCPFSPCPYSTPDRLTFARAMGFGATCAPESKSHPKVTPYAHTRAREKTCPAEGRVLLAAADRRRGMTRVGFRSPAILEVESWGPARRHRARSHASIGAETGPGVIRAPENKVGRKSAPTRARDFVGPWADAARKGGPRNEHDACWPAASGYARGRIVGACPAALGSFARLNRGGDGPRCDPRAGE